QDFSPASRSLVWRRTLVLPGSREAPDEKRGHYRNHRQQLPLGRWIEGIAGDFQLEPLSRPSAFEVKGVVLLRLQNVRSHGDRIVAKAERELFRQNRQLVPWIDRPVYKLDGETLVLGWRPHEYNEQGDDDEEPPLKVVWPPHRLRSQ